MNILKLPAFALFIPLIMDFSDNGVFAADDAVMRKPPDKLDTTWFVPLTTVKSVMKSDRGARLEVDGEKVWIDFIRSDVVRLKISQNGIMDARPTGAVINDDFGPVPFEFARNDTVLVLSTQETRFVVNLKAFSFDIYRADGSVVVKSIPGKAYMSLNDLWAVTRVKKPEDSFLGFGEKTAYLNHNGQYLQMWNADMYGEMYDPFRIPGVGKIEGANESWNNLFHDPLYISIPLYYHLPADNPGLASASFIDNGYHLHYDLTAADTLKVVGEGGQLTEYFFAGPSIKKILSEYTDLTGRMKAPPLWALGHHQCRWYDYVEKDIYDLADNYRSKKIPNDVFWLDIDYMNGFRVFTWDYRKFPDPLRLSRDLNDRGFRLVTIIDPGIKYDPGYTVFEEGREQNLFCKTVSGKIYTGKVWPGLSAFPDFVRGETRDWWAKLIARHALNSELSGIWIDMNEPAIEKAPKDQMRFDRDGADYEHERYHNQYGFLMARATDEGLLRARPGVRSFVLSRSGFAGIQRYAANWTGDNPVTWGQFAVNIPMNCNLGISGQPFTGSDIRSGGDEELFIRWYEYAVFYPFCRNHSGDYPWVHGRRAEDCIRKAIEFRYRILPYLYTAMMRATETSEPVMRPLVFDFQGDRTATDVSDQFMFGEHILVAPVMKKGTVERTLYLPPGDWYRFGEPGHLSGQQTITARAPIDECPVYVRAGAVIPTAPLVQSTAMYKPEEIILNVYIPVADGEYVSYLHEDDGITYTYLDGACYKTELRVSREGGTVRLSGVTTGNGYPGFVRKRFIVRAIGDTITEKVISNSGRDFTLVIGK